jgi:hypothetical protein
MTTKFGKWFRKVARVVSTDAIRVILDESDTSLSSLKKVAKKNAVRKAQEAKAKSSEADKLAMEAKALLEASETIQSALLELDCADGRL